MSTNKWQKRDYDGSKFDWDTDAHKRFLAQEGQKAKNRRTWRSNRFLQRSCYVLRVSRKYGHLSPEAVRAHWFALKLLGLKPFDGLLVTYPVLRRFV